MYHLILPRNGLGRDGLYPLLCYSANVMLSYNTSTATFEDYVEAGLQAKSPDTTILNHIANEFRMSSVVPGRAVPSSGVR
jgi:hypothetical protein